MKNPLLKYLPLKSYILAQSFLSFTVICTFKLSILLYSKTAHEGKKLVKYMFCSNMYIQNVYFFILKQLMRNKNMSNSCFVATCTFKSLFCCILKQFMRETNMLHLCFFNNMYIQNVYFVVLDRINIT